jgi:iron complex outermembrane receptor protein
VKLKPLSLGTSLALASAVTLNPFTVSSSQAALVLETVTVTAERLEGTLQETPIAVTAFTTDKIEDLGILDVSDLGSMAPNMNIQKQPSSNSNMSIFIRGVGSGETSLMVDPKTSFYIDGVYMSKTVGGVFDIVDMERIEILRGPQGTLFGRNSSGGAVNVTTIKPSGELYVRAGVTYGNDGLQRYNLTADLPKIADSLSIRLNGSSVEYDGWADNNFPAGTIDVNGRTWNLEQDLGSEDNEAYRIAVRYEPVERLTLDYAYDKTDNRGVPTPFQITKVKDSLYNGFTDTPTPFTFLGGELYQQMAATVGDPDERREDWELDSVTEEYLKVEGHSFQANYDFDNVTVKYIFGDRETKSGYGSTDLDGGNYFAPDLFYGDFPGEVAPGTAIPKPGFIAAIDEGYIEMTTHELQVFGSAFEERLNYTFGVYYYEEEVYQDNPQTFSLPIAFVAPRSEALLPLYQSFGYCDADALCQGSQRLPIPNEAAGADPNLNGYVDFVYGQEAESIAVYTQVTYAATDQLDITAGLRYTEDEKDAFVFNETLNHLSIADRLTASDKWDNVSYLLRANYNVRDGLNFYGSVSTGYNSGGFNSRAGSVSAWESVVDEETVTSYELGMKSEWLDRRVRANVAIFYNDYEDIQLAVFEAGSGGASSRLVNAGAATYQGIELDLTALLTEELSLDLTYGYLDAEFDEYLALNPATNLEEDISDIATVTRAPEHTASLNLSYVKPCDFGTFSANIGATYTDSMVFHPFNNQFDSADDRTLVHARIGMGEMGMGEHGNLRVSLWGKNLTDEEYREWGIDFGSLGFAGNTFGTPRTYGIDVVYEYQ